MGLNGLMGLSTLSGLSGIRGLSGLTKGPKGPKLPKPPKGRKGPMQPKGPKLGLGVSWKCLQSVFSVLTVCFWWSLRISGVFGRSRGSWGRVGSWGC